MIADLVVCFMAAELAAAVKHRWGSKYGGKVPSVSIRSIHLQIPRAEAWESVGMRG